MAKSEAMPLAEAVRLLAQQVLEPGAGAVVVRPGEPLAIGLGELSRAGLIWVGPNVFPRRVILTAEGAYAVLFGLDAHRC